MATVEPAEESFFQDVEAQMTDVVDTPESFLTPSAELEDKLLQVTKQLFDFGKTQKYCYLAFLSIATAKQREPVELGPLPELLVEGFETDQIWEEIQLQNQPLWHYLNKQITNLQDKEIAFFTESKKNKRKVQHEENEEDDNQDDEVHLRGTYLRLTKKFRKKMKSLKNQKQKRWMGRTCKETSFSILTRWKIL